MSCTDQSQSASTEQPQSISQRKLNANRRNAAKSTGPRSSAGKQKSSQNATTHGLYCAHLLLPGESQSDFNEIRAGLLADLAPTGPYELLLVDRIIIAVWKLQRLQQAETEIHHITVESMVDCRNNDRQQWFEDHADELDPDADNSDHPDAPRILRRSDITLPAATAFRLTDPDQDLHRLYTLQQRLENTIHRCQRDLLRLRYYRQNQPPHTPPPPSPSANGPALRNVEAQPATPEQSPRPIANPTPPPIGQSAMANGQSSTPEQSSRAIATPPPIGQSAIGNGQSSSPEQSSTATATPPPIGQSAMANGQSSPSPSPPPSNLQNEPL
jgi:hypothetical protein